MTRNKQIRLKLLCILLLAVIAVGVDFPRALSFFPTLERAAETLMVRFGLDIQGGVHLEYKAETERVDADKVADAVAAAQAVVERRVNAFGVSEPVVQTAQSGDEYRIIVELPGVKDINEAKAKIQDAPFLEFKEENPEAEKTIDALNEEQRKKAEGVLGRALSGEDFAQLAREESEDPGSKENGGDLDFAAKGAFVPEFDEALFDSAAQPGQVFPELVETPFGWHIIKIEEVRGEGDGKEVRARHILLRKYSVADFPDLAYGSTGLTGGNLKSASVEFSQSGGLGTPQVAIQFDGEGAKMFADITKRNIGKPLAIFIDGELETAPTVQAAITDGNAVITGDYTVEEANHLKQRLNEGALPVPLTLISQQSVEASVGMESLRAGLRAGAIGLAAVSVFLIAYYRLLGLLAVAVLVLYALIFVAIFKISSIPAWPYPIVLTLSGIAAFTLSIGMAVDANVLIFERMKEELRAGKDISTAAREGFRRAWSAVRDGSYSTILTTVILLWMSTGFVKGLALILIIGVLLSLFSNVVVARTILLALPLYRLEKYRWLIISRK